MILYMCLCVNAYICACMYILCICVCTHMHIYIVWTKMSIFHNCQGNRKNCFAIIYSRGISEDCTQISCHVCLLFPSSHQKSGYIFRTLYHWLNSAGDSSQRLGLFWSLEHQISCEWHYEAKAEKCSSSPIVTPLQHTHTVLLQQIWCSLCHTKLWSQMFAH